ncbi:MAG: VCBS repeat-containing protein, partial [Bacteroidota bacterium]
MNAHSCFLLSRWILLLMLVSGCTTSSSEKEKNSVVSGKFVPKSGAEIGISFVNQVNETESENIVLYDYLYNGAGVGVADFNGDQYPDIYFAGNQVQDELYINQRNGSFAIAKEAFPISQPKGWSSGVSVVDINKDGHMDVYVTKTGPDSRGRFSNELWVNDGSGSFEDQAAEYGLDYKGHCTQATFFDADADGDLDVYLLTHPGDFKYNLSAQDLNNFLSDPNTESDVLMINENGKFENSNSSAGIADAAFGLGVAVADFDGDHWPDIYVSNDFDEGDLLYINQQDGTFKNEIDQRFKHTSNFGMGCDAADFDNDGKTDLFTADMAFEDHVRSKKNMETMDPEKFAARTMLGWHYQYMSNCLQWNRGDVFSEIAHMSGVAQSDWSWSPLFVDVDNDGWKDLVISNGYKRDTKNQDLRGKVEELKASKDSISLQDVLAQMPSTTVANKIYK